MNYVKSKKDIRSPIWHRIIKNQKMELRQRKKPEIETYDIRDYAESIGPQGLQIVIDSKSTIVRKLSWLTIIFFGVLYSGYNIRLCALRYLSYPSTIKPTQDSTVVVRFPKVTICNNVSLRFQSTVNRFRTCIRNAKYWSTTHGLLTYYLPYMLTLYETKTDHLIRN